MKLFLFGRLRDGAEALHGAHIAIETLSVRQLLRWIEANHPDLSAALQQPGVRFAVDRQFAELDTQISAESEVAFMAPLSGG